MDSLRSRERGSIMDLYLKHKTIIVTGGSKGIGKAAVLALLKEGAFVTACARNEKNLEGLFGEIPENLHSCLLTLPGDVLSEEDMRQAVKKTTEHFGKLDGIVANAGSGSSGTVLETDMKEWKEQFHMKMGSVLNLVKPAVPELLKSEHPRIVIMNGVTANVPEPDMAAVSAARASVSQAARMLALALAPGICVNTVNIGAIDTGRQHAKYQRSDSGLTYPEWKRQEAQRRGIPMERIGTVEEVVPMILLLLSPLSSYITASAIDISGGLNTR